jgi:serine/threonine-protein kinase
MQTDILPVQIDRYTLDRKLSQGGMAEVFLGHRSVAGVQRRVVVKSILPDFVSDQSFVDMMFNEARIAVGLSHPNIVQVEDLLDVGGRPFIVMEYLAGRNLREVLRCSVKSERRLALPFVCGVLNDVLDGLQHAHNRVDAEGRSLGLVHRDVSPANVIVTWSGVVKLIDFGIAKATSLADDALTRAGQRKGKSAYMSPEQVRREPLDRRSDVFSAGILMWEMLTSRRLFSRKSEVDSMIAICDVDAPPPSAMVPGLPPEIDAICKKALSRDREQRYQSAEEMREEIEAFMVSQSWTANSLTVQAELEALFPGEGANAESHTGPIPFLPSMPSESVSLVAEPESQESPSEEPIVVPAFEALEREPSARSRAIRSAEIMMLDQLSTGPSVYDDLEIDGTISRKPLWSRLALVALGVLVLSGVASAMAQRCTPAAASSLGSAAVMATNGGGR